MNKYILDRTSIISFMLFFISLTSLFSQDKEFAIDSLMGVLRKDSAGTIQMSKTDRVDIWNRLARLYLHEDYAKTRKYGENALQEAVISRYRSGEGHAYTILGNLCLSEGLYEKALEYHLRALEIREETKDSIWLARNYTNIALIYDYWGQYEKSLAYYFKSLKIKEALNDDVGIVVTLNNIGVVYFYLGKHSEALDIHFKAVTIEEKIEDIVGLVYSYSNIGEIYLEMNMLHEAEGSFLKSIELNQKAEDNYVQALNYSNLGTVYHKMGRESDALECFNIGLALNEGINNVEAVTMSYLQMGRFYYDIGNMEKSIEFLEQSYEKAREINYRPRIIEATIELTKPLKYLGRFREALYFMEAYASTRDTMYTEESTRLIAEMKTRYETDKKEKEIQIQNLQLAKNKETIQKKNIALTSALGGGFLFLILILIIYRLYRKKNIAYHHLLRQNLEAVACEHMKETIGIDPKMEIIDKYQKSALSDNQKSMLVGRLVELLDKGKIYRDSNLSIDDLASKLNTNRTYLSQTINEYLRQNFTSMINEYRVKEARQLLTSEKFKHLTIEGIARQVGFNSKSSFNTAFKNFTGLTPSYYLHLIKHKETA